MWGGAPAAAAAEFLLNDGTHHVYYRLYSSPSVVSQYQCRYGRVVRPGLGVMCLHDIHSRQLLGSGSGSSGGVVIQSVVPKSGAEQAGLR